MGWMQKLLETYERCFGASQFENDPLMPISHTRKQSHIEIVIDGDGNFLEALPVKKEEITIPCTENSDNRSGSKLAPHPLCDKIQYVAADYRKFGGLKMSGKDENKGKENAEYLDILNRWCESEHAHPKAAAVLAYVRRGTVVADLVQAGLLVCKDSILLTKWDGDKDNIPQIFKVLTGNNPDQGDAFVRFRVQIPGETDDTTWTDKGLQQAWIAFDNVSNNSNIGVCMVTGETTRLAVFHPKRIRHAGDNAKIISSNDKSGFTFRGQFTTAVQAVSVGFSTTQKAHNCLRWLIARQGYHEDTQVFVAWHTKGEQVPSPLDDSFDLFKIFGGVEEDLGYKGDAGQYLAKQLNKLIGGYKGKIADTDSIVMMGLDSATPGRLAITYYRELTGSDFLARIKKWHESCAWHQNFGKDLKF